MQLVWFIKDCADWASRRLFKLWWPMQIWTWHWNKGAWSKNPGLFHLNIHILLQTIFGWKKIIRQCSKNWSNSRRIWLPNEFVLSAKRQDIKIWRQLLEISDISPIKFLKEPLCSLFVPLFARLTKISEFFYTWPLALLRFHKIWEKEKHTFKDFSQLFLLVCIVQIAYGSKLEVARFEEYVYGSSPRFSEEEVERLNPKAWENKFHPLVKFQILDLVMSFDWRLSP